MHLRLVGIRGDSQARPPRSASSVELHRRLAYVPGGWMVLYPLHGYGLQRVREDR
jgi:hypothetical protein